MEFYFPTRIVTGRGCVAANAARLSAFGSRCLIVTGRTSAVKCGALADVERALDRARVQYRVFDKITQNPLYSDCCNGAKAAREFGADFIVGIGGGSPLDASKAVACLAPNPGAGESDMYAQTLENPPLPVVAVGTTAGTGSEVTQVAVITGSNGQKKSFRSDSSFPVLALGDPAYTEFMPDGVTRSTAADALAHCIESYFNTTANDFSRMYALSGAKVIIDVFRSFPADGALSKAQRDSLYRASLFGGIAISVTGTCIPHSLSYFLTERYGVAHGAACAFWLPHFIEHNLEFAPKLCDEFFDYVKITPSELVSLLNDIVPKPRVSVSKSELSELAPRWKNNSCLKKAMGGIDNEYLERLLEKEFLKQEEV